MDSRPQPKLQTGDVARDTITGYSGVVVAITNWLNGCRRITIQAKELHDGVPVDSQTFDAEQVELEVEVTLPIARISRFGTVAGNVDVVGKPGGPAISPTRNPDP